MGDRLVEKPKPISFPGEPTRPEVAAQSVIVARCGVPNEGLRRQTINKIHHPDQGTGRKVFGPITAELIIEDQPKRIIQIKVFFEPLSRVNEKPASMRASPMPGFMHLAWGAPKACPRLPKRDRLHQLIPIDQDWRQIPPRSLAGGPLMGDVLFGVVSSVREETHACGSRGASVVATDILPVDYAARSAELF